MFALLVRLLVIAVAIWAAAELIPGVELTSDPAGIFLVALVFGIINAVLRPIVMVLGLPFIILTLGIFALLINAALFGLTAALTDHLHVTGFWPAFWGAIVVSVVSWFLGGFLVGPERTRQRSPR